MKKLLMLPLMLSILNSSTLSYADYRINNRPNICYQTAEKFEGVWYELTYEQKEKTVKLALLKHTPRFMVIGGVPLKFYERIGDREFYNGITKKGRLLRVSVETQNRSILNLSLGNLNMKEFTCKER